MTQDERLVHPQMIVNGGVIFTLELLHEKSRAQLIQSNPGGIAGC
jgi:hypothetical protein